MYFMKNIHVGLSWMNVGKGLVIMISFRIVFLRVGFGKYDVVHIHIEDLVFLFLSG